MNSFCAPELNLQNDKRIAKSNTFVTVQLEKKSVARTFNGRQDGQKTNNEMKKNEIISGEKKEQKRQMMPDPSDYRSAWLVPVEENRLIASCCFSLLQIVILKFWLFATLTRSLSLSSSASMPFLSLLGFVSPSTQHNTYIWDVSEVV